MITLEQLTDALVQAQVVFRQSNGEVWNGLKEDVDLRPYLADAVKALNEKAP